jgi:membrane protease YdiL (CAAX protease family)
MQPTPTIREENSPFLQLLLLGAYALVGIIVIMIIGFVIAFLVYGTVLLKDIGWLNGNSTQYVGALKILLTAQQIGLFLVPAILLGITEGKAPQKFYGMKMPNISTLFLVFLIMLCSTPLMSLVNELNQKMILPDFLKGLEEWMRKLENEGAKTTETILKMSSVGGFLINLIVIAIVPAICEEFIFRGALQRTVLRIIKNPHFAIWTSAIIFSTIHFQFFGFFPRLLLGAGFGYIYFWTGSIWYTIFAHFLNNAYAVSVAWYFQKHNLPIDTDDGTSFAWYGYVISAVLTIALFKLLKDKVVKKNE